MSISVDHLLIPADPDQILALFSDSDPVRHENQTKEPVLVDRPIIWNGTVSVHRSATAVVSANFLILQQNDQCEDQFCADQQ